MQVTARTGVLEVLALFGVVVAVRAVTLEHQPVHDEIFHVLAARSWAEDGTFRIADGEYTRAFVFTAIVGWFYQLFGDSPTVARLPSLLFGSLWVVAVFVWTRAVAGRTAAWIAGFLFCLAPGGIFLSQFIRFYALHGLVFWLGATGLYLLLTRRLSLPATAALAAAVAACFAFALHLQATTVIGLAALGAWVAVELASRPAVRQALLSRRYWPFTAAAVLLVLAGVFFLAQGGTLERLWRSYQNALLWNQSTQDAFRFYHYLYLEQYPTLWTLLPLGALFVIVRRPRLGLFCVVTFATALILHSFAGTKWERYFYYAMPFFFVMWGIVLAEMIPPVRALLRRVAERAFQAPSPRLATWTEWGGLVAVAAFLIASNSAFPETARTLLTHPKWPEERRNWAAAAERLKPSIDEAAVLVTTNAMMTLYYLGRYDVSINRSDLKDIAPDTEFVADPRTGGRMISTADSMRLVLTCYPDGLFVTNLRGWRHPLFGINDQAADLLVAQAEEIALPEEWLIRAFRWRHADWDAGRLPPECAALPKIGRG